MTYTSIFVTAKINDEPFKVYFCYSFKIYIKTVFSKYIFQLFIRVITKLPNSEQSYKGKVKTHNYINRQNKSTTGKL